MEFVNFKLVDIENQQIIELNYLGKTLDLHNAAEFLRFIYEINSMSLILEWRYYFDDKISLFHIKFENVSYLKVSPRDIEIPLMEDDCLEEIICLEQLEFRFMGGMKIVVNADKINLIFLTD